MILLLKLKIKFQFVVSNVKINTARYTSKAKIVRCFFARKEIHIKETLLREFFCSTIVFCQERAKYHSL